MRRWERAFRRASFRGVRFWVDQDEPEVGRRIAVHEVSGGETPITEDMGRLSTEYRVTAYVTSDFADVEGIALEIACQAPGASILTLPMDPPTFVHCLRCSRSRSRDRNGHIGYDLVFVEAGSATVSPTSGLPAVRQVFAGGLAAAAAGLAGAFR